MQIIYRLSANTDPLMSTALIELEDRIITDAGEVVAKHDLLIKKILSEEIFTALRAVNHPDIALYNYRAPDNQITIWKDDEEFEGPAPETYRWTIPKMYLEMDIEEAAIRALAEKNLDETYEERLVYELEQMREKEMFPFVRCLCYVTEIFRRKDVVWGIGRGSSCASLVLFLLGINRVDPVKYGIPPEEFFK